MKTGRDYKDVERLQYEIAPHSSYYAAVTDADRRHIPPLVAPPCILQARSASRSRLAGWPPASCCGHKGNDVVPVSYTHLDVYKRQTLHRSNTLWKPVAWIIYRLSAVGTPRSKKLCSIA